jgi:hypothetical protein
MKKSKLCVLLIFSVSFFGSFLISPIGAIFAADNSVTLSEKEKLTEQILESTGMMMRIDVLTEQAPQNVKSKVRSGYVFNGTDISKNEFWQPLLSDYASRKETIKQTVLQSFYKYFSEKYSEGEMKEILVMVTSEGWKKMMQNMGDPENPANTLEKQLRNQVYELIKEKTQNLKKQKG